MKVVHNSVIQPYLIQSSIGDLLEMQQFSPSIISKIKLQNSYNQLSKHLWKNLSNNIYYTFPNFIPYQQVILCKLT